MKNNDEPGASVTGNPGEPSGTMDVRHLTPGGSTDVQRRWNIGATLALALVGVGSLAIVPSAAVDTIHRPTVPRIEVPPREVPPAPIDSIAAVGQAFPSAPDLGTAAGWTEPSEPELRDVQRHLRAGDGDRALRTAQRLVQHRNWGRDRDAAWLVIGMLHREAGRANLASEAFTKVRTSKGPLAPWGAFHEAEQDLERGKEWVAIQECEAYRKKWPEGPHASRCLRLQARAHAMLGRVASARTLAKEHDDAHELGPISEQVELTLAQWEADNAPERAVDRLQDLAVSYNAPLTGRVAEELLQELAAAGVAEAELPSDTLSLKTRAISLRDTKRKDEAWAAFEELVERSADDPDLAEWCAQSVERFAWRTHRWDALADFYAAQYQEEGRAEDAWGAYQARSRGGEYAQAAEWAELGQAKHGGTREWRRKEEDIGRTLLLARDYPAARDQFDAVAARGGWTGRRASFFAGFAAFMAGEDADAVERFTTIIDRKRSYGTESRYWRSRALERLERPEEAAADQAQILLDEPSSWYALLLAQGEASQPRTRPLLRDGTWPGTPPLAPAAEALALSGARQHRTALPVARPVAPRIWEAASGFALLGWPSGPAEVLPELPAPPPSIVERVNELEPPASYRPGRWFDEDEAERASRAFTEKHSETWTHLPAIHDLARAGLYDESGPLFAQFYEDWREAYRHGSHRRHKAARDVRGMDQEKWRELFLFTRDHHHSSRWTYGLWEDQTDPALARQARRLAYPLAHATEVFAQGREHGVDPYLVIGLMRSESTYNAIAVSRVGARGAMQIMPRTGHLLADLAHDTEFTAGDLEDPLKSVDYGITYLGLLLDRFEGAFPLAVASYNGGPFNVSAWRRGTTAEMPMDAWVEHIPFRETRRYTKSVSASYGVYVDLYGPDGAAVVLPETPRGDDPEVVDF